MKVYVVFAFTGNGLVIVNGSGDPDVPLLAESSSIVVPLSTIFHPGMYIGLCDISVILVSSCDVVSVNIFWLRSWYPG